MSRLWTDPITLILLGNTAFLRRQPNGTRRALAETLVVKCESDNFGELMSQVHKAVKERTGWQRTGKLTVILGNNWVRYAALPWVDDFMRREERISYARIAMVKQYGQAASEWEIRLSEAEYGAPWLAAGVDTNLIAELDSLAEMNRWHIESIQPALMTIANEFRLRLAAGAVRLVLIEKERAVVARLDDGRWRQVRSRRIASMQPIELEKLIAQEALLDPDEAWTTSRLCVWAFDAPAEVAAGWRALRAEVFENPDMQGLLAQRRI